MPKWGNCTRQAVLIADVPDTFRPQSTWSYPDAIAGGELFVKNVNLSAAVGFAMCFNKRAMQANMAERKWALVVRLSKFYGEATEDPRVHRGPPISAEIPPASIAQQFRFFVEFCPETTIVEVHYKNEDSEFFLDAPVRSIIDKHNGTEMGSGQVLGSAWRDLVFTFLIEESARAAAAELTAMLCEQVARSRVATRLPDAKEAETSSEQTTPDSQTGA